MYAIAGSYFVWKSEWGCETNKYDCNNNTFALNKTLTLIQTSKISPKAQAIPPMRSIAPCRSICHSLQVLTIQLLRFVYDIELQRKRKVGQTVRIPDTLDLSSYVSTDDKSAAGDSDGSEEGHDGRTKPTIYRLSSILYHKGNSADMGHYVAEVQNHALKKWFVLQLSRSAELLVNPKSKHAMCVIVRRFNYDDTNVEPSAVPSEDKQRTSNTAYMLVYHREDRVQSEKVGLRLGQGWCRLQVHISQTIFLICCVCGDRLANYSLALIQVWNRMHGWKARLRHRQTLPCRYISIITRWVQAQIFDAKEIIVHL